MPKGEQNISNPRQIAKVPFSQDETKITAASQQDCVDEMRRLVEAHPDMVISRNFFRVHSRLAESAWTYHFGTFQEFKKGANVTPSRHVQNHEKHIAKHASVDAYRQLNAERKGWEGHFQSSDRARFQTHAIITDTHDTMMDPFVRRVWLETLERCSPQRVVYGGDAFDLPEFGKYSVDPREWDVVGRIKAVHELFSATRAVAGNAQIDLIEGNHEHRLLRHLAEASPAMRAILADLHGFTVPRLLGLTAYEVNYIARADLHGFWQKDINAEVRKNYLVVDDAYLVHHFPDGMSMGLPGMHGHHHKHIVWPKFDAVRGPYEWHQLGAGHRRQASYCAGEKWQNGFMLAHLDRERRHVAFEYVDLTYNHACVGGRWYERLSSEVIG
jgi:hypothetical protein